MRRRSRLRWLMCAATVWVAAAINPIAQPTSSRLNTYFAALEFRNIGPATMGGRIDDVAVASGRSAVFYVGTASGGVWKTENNATTWTPVFDHESVASIGALAVERDDPNVVWAGTGENNNRQSSTWGGGVFKSIDGGKTWKNLGLAETKHIGRIVIDPTNSSVVYVAAAGHLWGSNPERGVFKTTDGGATWTRALFVDAYTGASDLVMDPSNSRVLYAAMYQRQRTPWGFNGGGPGSGLYKSRDGGQTWTKLTNGLPSGPLGRIGLDIYRGDASIVYAIVEHEEGSGVYRSNDAGDHWTKVSSTNPRPMYFSQVRVDPNDPHRLYVLGVRLQVSDDGGATFTTTRLSHLMPGGDRPRDDMDLHAMWIDPTDSRHLIVGFDAGLAISYDRARTWDYVDNLPIGQFYRVGYDMDVPYHVYGGLQDNDVWFGPSAVRNRWGIANHEWETLSIGDGFAAFADPRESRVVYAETQDGAIARVDRDTNERKTIKPQIARGESPLRWNWDTPLMPSPHDPRMLFIAANRIFRSTDRGDTWETISPDLTSHVDRDTLTIMGVNGKDIKLSKHDGVSAYPSIVAFAESPKRAGVYYSGADDGMVHMSRDGGKNWTNLSANFPGLPSHAWVSRIVASAFDEGTTYVTFNNYRNDDYKPYIYVTSDYGATWTSLAAGIPEGHSVRCLAEDTKNRNVLYLGTELGLFVSIDRGRSWQRVIGNLPTVRVDEITIHPRENDMLLATHGRSLWILDDLTPIQHAAEALTSSAHLFDIRRAATFNMSNAHANYPGDRQFWGQNLEPGALISYHLDREPKEIVLTIRNERETIVRVFGGDDLKTARRAGLNRMSWDLRHQPIPAPIGGANGPFVLPGRFTVTLSIDGKDVATRTVQVDGDPLIQITDADRALQHDTALGLHELQRAATNAAIALRGAREQLRTIQDALKLSAAPSPERKSTADNLEQRMTALARQLGTPAPPQGAAVDAEEQSGNGVDLSQELSRLHQTGGASGGPAAQPLRDLLGALKGQITASTSGPTPAQLQRARELREDMEQAVAEFNDIVSTALPSLYKAVVEGRQTLTPTPPITLPGK